MYCACIYAENIWLNLALDSCVCVHRQIVQIDKYLSLKSMVHIDDQIFQQDVLLAQAAHNCVEPEKNSYLITLGITLHYIFLSRNQEMSGDCRQGKA